MDNLLGLVIVGMLMIAVLIGIYCVDSSINEWKCERSAKVMNMQARWEYATGCMVKSGGQWAPLSSFRTVGGVE